MHYKGCLVAQGFSQCPGFEYLEVFAPTVHLPTLRIILALAALHDLHLWSVDVSGKGVWGNIMRGPCVEDAKWAGAGNHVVWCWMGIVSNWADTIEHVDWSLCGVTDILWYIVAVSHMLLHMCSYYSHIHRACKSDVSFHSVSNIGLQVCLYAL